MYLKVEETETETRLTFPRAPEHGDSLVYTTMSGQRIVLWYGQGYGWRVTEDD